MYILLWCAQQKRFDLVCRYEPPCSEKNNAENALQSQPEQKQEKHWHSHLGGENDNGCGMYVCPWSYTVTKFSRRKLAQHKNFTLFHTTIYPYFQNSRFQFCCYCDSEISMTAFCGIDKRCVWTDIAEMPLERTFQEGVLSSSWQQLTIHVVNTRLLVKMFAAATLPVERSFIFSSIDLVSSLLI